jgi:acyl dehydratase
MDTALGTTLDDLTLGATCELGSFTFDEADMVDYARRYDPQTMHTDPVAALEEPVGGLIASGWQTASVAMRLMIDAKPFGIGRILGVGVDGLRWPKPVRPGDTISGSVEVAEIKPSTQKPDRGMVRLRLTLKNQNGETVMTSEPMMILSRRPQT